jgi:hypothetical protein
MWVDQLRCGEINICVWVDELRCNRYVGRRVEYVVRSISCGRTIWQNERRYPHSLIPPDHSSLDPSSESNTEISPSNPPPLTHPHPHPILSHLHNDTS